MITQQSLERDYDFFKNHARLSIDNKKYEEAVDAFKTMGSIAQNYCLYYVDQEMESMLNEIAREIVNKDETYTPVSGRIIFYDDYSRDNIMLTAQYINALCEQNIEFMYLTLNPNNVVTSQRFYKTLYDYPKAIIRTAVKGLSLQESIDFLVDAIEEFRPEKVLIHTRPEDIVGILPWYQYSEVERYYVEVADHSFWPGVKAIDYCICFRNYGYSNAIALRGLKTNQLLILPYYPYVENCEFNGIPESIPNSIKLFSGGRVTKILDNDDTFLNLIKRVLEQHPNTEFYFAGGGVIDGAARFAHVREFIKSNGLEHRFYLLGQRKDILEVTKHMDIFINTYPIGGGLMVQIAAKCGLPVVILSKNGLCASIEEFIRDDAWINPEITYFSDIDIDNELTHLICDAQYRKKRGRYLSDQISSPPIFSSNLKLLLNEKKSAIKPFFHEGDYEIRRKVNIEMENMVFHRYYGILLRSRVLRKKRPLRYVLSAVKLIIMSDKGYLCNTVMRYLKK